MEIQSPYQPQNKVRIVTAASLFDGHDAAINIMRRIMQSSGAEIIHLGHNRSVQEIVNTAIGNELPEQINELRLPHIREDTMNFSNICTTYSKKRVPDILKYLGGAVVPYCRQKLKNFTGMA